MGSRLLKSTVLSNGVLDHLYHRPLTVVPSLSPLYIEARLTETALAASCTVRYFTPVSTHSTALRRAPIMTAEPDQFTASRGRATSAGVRVYQRWRHLGALHARQRHRAPGRLRTSRVKITVERLPHFSQFMTPPASVSNKNPRDYSKGCRVKDVGHKKSEHS